MNRILNDIKSFKGNVLCIGVDDNQIMKQLKKNTKVGIYELNRDKPRRLFSKKKRMKTQNGKSVKIKKFRKVFKKKSFSYLILNLNSVFDYYKYMTSNSICVCQGKIYVYGHSDYINAKDIACKFKRYNTKIEQIQIDDNYLVIIDSSKATFSKVKEKFYLIVDTFYNIGDMISYFLTS